jgi:hypothetical protein
MSIKVGVPEHFSYVAMDSDGRWHIFVKRPWLSSPTGKKPFIYWDEPTAASSPVKVTGYKGKWEDSLHEVVDGEWREVK